MTELDNLFLPNVSIKNGVSFLLKYISTYLWEGSTGHITEFYQKLPQILLTIFGFHKSKGWIHHITNYTAHLQDIKALFDLLSPTPAHSLSVYNAASSPLTLTNMLIIAGIGMPLVLGYTIAIYRIFRGKVTLDDSSY